MDIQACIFDFDGVVVDSEKYHHLAWQWVAEKIGTTISYDEYAPLKSAGRKTVIPYLFAKAGRTLTDADYEYYAQLREQMAHKALAQLSSGDIMPGLVDFVRLLKANGIRCAVASASSSSHLVAARFGLYNLFDVFVDGTAGRAAKPDPDIYLYTASRLGVEPKACVVFEDSISGVKGALAAGMHCIGIQTNFTDKADKIIDNFEGATLSLLQL